MSRPRVGLVGARRRRQGLGPFVARDLVRAGACVPCFVTTSAATRDAASGQLAAICGVETRGYSNVDEMLARERLDALAILSPAETHAAYLESAAAAAWIAQRTDRTKRARLLALLATGIGADQALIQVLGVDTAGVDLAVREEIRGEFPSETAIRAPRPEPAKLREGAR